MNKLFKYSCLLLLFPCMSFAQLRDYIPMLSLYAGGQIETVKLKTTNDLSYFSGGSTQLMHAKFGICFFRIFDIEAGAGYDFRKIKEKLPVTCVNGICPDKTHRYAQNVTLNYAARFRFFFATHDDGDFILYPFVKMGCVAELSTSKRSKSYMNNEWSPTENSPVNKAWMYNNYAVGAEAIFGDITPVTANIAVNFYHNGNDFNNSDYLTFGFGVELGFNFIFDPN